MGSLTISREQPRLMSSMSVHGAAALVAIRSGLCNYRWRIDEMLGDEPHLQLVRPQDVGDENVVRRVVAHLARAARSFSRLFDDEFVCLEQAGQHRGDFLDSVRRAR